MTSHALVVRVLVRVPSATMAGAWPWARWVFLCVAVVVMAWTWVRELEVAFQHSHLSVRIDQSEFPTIPWLPYVSRGVEQGLCGDLPGWVDRLAHLSSERRAIVAEVTGGAGGGFGSRARGLASFLTVALLTKRAFYLRWNLVAKLEDHLQPNLYDWRLPPNACTSANSTKWHLHDDQARMSLFADTDHLPQCLKLEGDDMIALCWARDVPQLANEADATHFDMADMSYRRGCVWHALFRPRDHVLRLLHDVRRELGIKEDTILVGIHARFGGNLDIEGLANDTSVVDRVQRTGSAEVSDLVECAARLEGHFGVDSARVKWYIAADSVHLKEAAAALRPDRVVYPADLNVLHIGRHKSWTKLGGDEKEQGFVSNLVDLYMLASSHYMVVTSSGFNLLAQGIGLLPHEHTVELVKTKDVSRPPVWNRIC